MLGFNTTEVNRNPSRQVGCYAIFKVALMWSTIIDFILEEVFEFRADGFPSLFA